MFDRFINVTINFDVILTPSFFLKPSFNQKLAQKTFFGFLKIARRILFLEYLPGIAFFDRETVAEHTESLAL